MSTRPFFSIVIPTLNEEKYLPHLLKDLTEQTFTDFEVIHVDGSSDDNTQKNAVAFSKGIKLKQLITPKRNVSHQRNLGCKSAKGSWIIFMDADNRLSQYFLEDLVSQLSVTKQCRVFTTWIEPDQKTHATETIVRAVNYIFELYRVLGKPVSFGALIGVHSEVIKSIQFDEQQKILEDSIFVQEAQRQGFPFVIFRHPKYVYSLRRLRKEGTLKLATQAALMNMRYIQGKTFEQQDFDYVMKGGSYYDTQPGPLLLSLHKLIRSASQRQLAQAKRLLESILD
ncbi:glycosyltransferase [Candidatus Woesebacteria bacterium]|nr:glycosyltransferase [Candidatus Woesebacteria bacterium]